MNLKSENLVVAWLTLTDIDKQIMTDSKKKKKQEKKKRENQL